MLTARRIFNELASKNAKDNPGTENEVLESEFRERVVSSGQGFRESSIDTIIEDMVKIGRAERIVKELDGTTYLRKRGD